MDVTKFDTGAVRSADAQGFRYDLISPVAMAVLDRTPIGPVASMAECLNSALISAYRFLWGNDERDTELAIAAKMCLTACHFQAFEESQEVTSIGIFDIPYEGMKRLAATCDEGAKKYSDFNWEKGMPAHDLLNHAIRHIYLYMSGDRTEDHIAHSAWGFCAAIHSFMLWPKLNEGHLRSSGCTPPVVTA